MIRLQCGSVKEWLDLLDKEIKQFGEVVEAHDPKAREFGFIKKDNTLLSVTLLKVREFPNYRLRISQIMTQTDLDISKSEEQLKDECKEIRNALSYVIENKIVSEDFIEYALNLNSKQSALLGYTHGVQQSLLRSPSLKTISKEFIEKHNLVELQLNYIKDFGLNSIPDRALLPETKAFIKIQRL